MWTKEQQRVIDARNCSILVSAAAGSGKTAVLVERILKQVTDSENPHDIDEYLVVTFTNAAAAQMRDKISAKIEAALEETPENEHLMRQLLLVNRADITTIDSFCLRMVKEHFSLLGLDSAFNIGDTGMMSLLKSDVLDELFNEGYETGSKSFLMLMDTFCAGYGDDELREIILSIYDMVSSYPIPEKWISDAKSALMTDSVEELENTPWMREYMRIARLRLDEALSLVYAGRSVCESAGGPDRNITISGMDEEFVTGLREASCYSVLYRLMDTPWKRLAVCKGDAYDEDLVESFKRIRNSYKDIVKELGANTSPDEILTEIRSMRSCLIPLLDLVESFMALYNEKKSSRRLYEFSDIEHMAYKLLCAGYDEDGRVIPTEVGREVSKRYQEIFIDEYQDSNYLQEDILCAVSGLDRGVHNMFMVGDVKQSIYRFRMARPDLFIKKYNSYGSSGADIKIELRNNFRSRAAVLDAVNYFFYQIMGENLGGIKYDEAAALVPTKQFPKSEGKNISERAELLILDGVSDDAPVKEASMIAERISELVDERNGLDIYDEEQDCYRRTRYGDIVILARSIKASGESLYNTLTDYGIPVYLDDPQGYFDAVEVTTILSLLSVVDNSRQDIPYAAVLISPMADITDNELAVVCSYAEEKGLGRELLCDKCSCYVLDNEDEISRKLSRIMNIIDELKKDRTSMSISALIWKAINITGYYTYAMAMPMGERRRANIDMLLEKASDYENGYYRGLFNFLRYIDRLKINAVDFGEAHMLDEDENMVKIISMHKSKGLEYPVVFVSGLGRQFNKSDSRKNLMIHSDYFLASMIMEQTARYKKKSMLREFFRMHMKQESMAEEERVLYVAMTRAKEKLILTGHTRDLEKLKEKYADVDNAGGLLMPYSVRQDAASSLQLIVAAMIRYNEVCRQLGLKDIIETRIIDNNELEGSSVKRVFRQEYTIQMINEMAKKAEKNYVYEKMEHNMEYVYPYEGLTAIRSKLSISDIKKLKAYDGNSYDIGAEYLKTDINEEHDTGKVGRTGISGSDRGTIIHKFMELFPFDGLKEDTDIRDYIEKFKRKLAEDDIMSDIELQVINVNSIYSMVTSKLGRRMTAAAQSGSLYRERQFSIKIPVNEIYDNLPDTDDVVIVQGIVDAYFFEGNNIILMDYKTDRTDKDTLIKRYRAQLEYYARTLSELLDRPVAESIIYSFSLGCEITV